MARAHIVEAQHILGVKADGDFGPVSLGALKRLHEKAHSEECPPTLKDGESSSLIVSPASMPLCERALDWCLGEADKWGSRRVTDGRKAEYFAGCTRNGKLIGDWLADEELKPGIDNAFCAAAQGFAEFRASLPGEHLPPWRSGALAIMHDAIDGRRPGETWMPLGHVMSGARPNKGAIVVYENTQVSGRGHVERLIECTSTGYRSVGANENQGRWVVDRQEIAFADAARADGTQRLRLLGFVVTA